LELRSSAFVEEKRHLELRGISGRAVRRKHLVKLVASFPLSGPQLPILRTKVEFGRLAKEIERQIRQPEKIAFLDEDGFVFVDDRLRRPSARSHVGQEVLEKVAVAVQKETAILIADAAKVARRAKKRCALQRRAGRVVAPPANVEAKRRLARKGSFRHG